MEQPAGSEGLPAKSEALAWRPTPGLETLVLRPTLGLEALTGTQGVPACLEG